MTHVSKPALIIQGDAVLRQSLSEQLGFHEGFLAITAADGKQALEHARNHHFEIILLDDALPDIDGRDLCRLLRRQRVKAPIIMMSAHDSDADTILALESGASDCLTKPFRLGVLLARVRAQHRQYQQLDDATFPIGPYRFRPSTKILTDSATGKRTHLTGREAAILKYLYCMGERPVPRQTLLDEVWGDLANVTGHAVETHIYRLRQKIEPDPGKLQILVTEADGYRLLRSQEPSAVMEPPALTNAA